MSQPDKFGPLVHFKDGFIVGALFEVIWIVFFYVPSV